MRVFFVYLPLFVLFQLISMTLSAQQWREIVKTSASDREAYDNFGHSVAISGDYAIVGARFADVDVAEGITLSDAGAAYIFEKDDTGNWTEVQKIVASDRAEGDNFGYSVAISGNYVIVGARYADEDVVGGNALSDAGAAYFFERDGTGNWIEVQKIVASDRAEADLFGWSVAISGNRAIVGAKDEDEDVNGANTMLASGSAYLFERDGTGNWTEVQKIVASDRFYSDEFGASVAISGDYAIIGASSKSDNGVVTIYAAGAAYIFERNGSGNWKEVKKIVASDKAEDDYFGISVSISGNYAVVGAFLEDHDAGGGNVQSKAGSAYIFEKEGTGNWTEVQKIVASDRKSFDRFGYSVSLSDTYIIVGAWGEDDDINEGNTFERSGSAYIFKRDGSGNWTENQKIVASDRAADDLFGWSVAISGNYAIVGAIDEDEDANGGNSLEKAGSAYFFYSCSSSEVDVSVTITSPTTLTANASDATFQWLDCNNSFLAIPGETNQSFTATKSGSYAVEVTQNGCTAISECFDIITLGILENNFKNELTVYPNPTTNGELTISLEKTYSNLRVIVTGITGKQISTYDFGTTKRAVINIKGEKGIYFVNISTTDGKAARVKVIKN